MQNNVGKSWLSLRRKKWGAFQSDILIKREAESKWGLELLDQQMAETVLVQNSLEEKMGMAVMLDAKGLTKELVDE